MKRFESLPVQSCQNMHKVRIICHFCPPFPIDQPLPDHLERNAYRIREPSRLYGAELNLSQQHGYISSHLQPAGSRGPAEKASAPMQRPAI